MSKKLRPPTRKDWNDISKLRFRNYHAEILDVKVFDNLLESDAFSVRVVRKAGSSKPFVYAYTIYGQTNISHENDDDIVIEEPEEVNYEEIVKELFLTKAIIKLNDRVSHITVIDLNDMNFLFCGTGWYKFDTITGMEISFDLKTFYTFNEYLELRRKQ